MKQERARIHDYDLFLCYNRFDRTLIDPLAEALRGRGLKVFKNDWYLRPGDFWPVALERNLAASRAIAVAFGRNGLGPWQQREAAFALDRQTRVPGSERPLPVIPVLLDRRSDPPNESRLPASEHPGGGLEPEGRGPYRRRGARCPSGKPA